MKRLGIRSAVLTGLLLLVPLVMSILDRHKLVGNGWHWSLMDFVVMGALLFGAGLSYEYFARRLDNKSHRVTLVVFLFCAVLCIWIELAVGGISQLLGSFIGTAST